MLKMICDNCGKEQVIEKPSSHFFVWKREFKYCAECLEKYPDKLELEHHGHGDAHMDFHCRY